MRLWRFVVAVLALWFLVSAQKCSDIEKRVCPGGKLVNRGGVIACEYPTTTTTSSTSTSTTTTTTSTTLVPATPVPPTPPPPAPPETCGLKAMPECGRPESSVGVYGCCYTDKHRPLPESPFGEVVDREQQAIARERPDMFDRDGRVNEDDYVSYLVWRLQQKGYCVTRGGPGDEIGIKASNAESFQYDVHLSNGRPRLYGYTAYCSPARH